MVIHGTCAMADQMAPDGTETVTLCDATLGVSMFTSGEPEPVYPLCVPAMTLEPTYMKPVLATRGEPYGETTNMQVPGAVPEPPEAIVIHEFVLLTAQEALFSLEMLKEPEPPSGPKPNEVPPVTVTPRPDCVTM